MSIGNLNFLEKIFLIMVENQNFIVYNFSGKVIT